MIQDLDEVHMENLKQIDSSEKADSKFIFYLLETMFTKEELKLSSVNGKRSNFNGVSYQKLDPIRIMAIKGKFPVSQFK